jgi:hypothetical protein
MVHSKNDYGARTGLINISEDNILLMTRFENRPLRTSKDMDPRLIVLYFHEKGWTVREIHDNLVATLGEEPIEYSTVT